MEGEKVGEFTKKKHESEGSTRQVEGNCLDLGPVCVTGTW